MEACVHTTHLLQATLNHQRACCYHRVVFPDCAHMYLSSVKVAEPSTGQPTHLPHPNKAHFNFKKNIIEKS